MARRKPPRNGVPPPVPETGSSVRDEEGYVAVPATLLARMGQSTDDALRVLLYLIYHEWYTRTPGAALALGPLAEGAGLSQGRALLALRALKKQGWTLDSGEEWHIPPQAPGEAELEEDRPSPEGN